MHNKVKSEQSFAVASAERVAVSQPSLKLEKLTPNSLTVTTNAQHQKDKTIYQKRVL